MSKENKQSDCFGLIGFGRVNSSKAQSLVGSSIKHSNLISLTISTASKQRTFCTDHFFADKSIVEIYMSQSQFAECITSMNMGSGVPCTLKVVNGRRMSDCEETSERQRLRDDFDNQIKSVNKNAKALTEVISGLVGKLNKRDQEAIKSAIRNLNQDIESNLPFVRTCFDESIDKSVKEAKAEVEAFVQNRQLSKLVENEPIRIEG